MAGDFAAFQPPFTDTAAVVPPDTADANRQHDVAMG